MRIDGQVAAGDLDPIWKRNVAVFGTSKGDFTESVKQADGSYIYTATAAGDVTCEWEGDKKETDRDLPVGTVVTYWPETGTVRIKQP